MEIMITTFMKKIQFNRFLFVSLVAFCITVATTSCRFEEDDYFSESASLRVEHAIDSVRSVLTQAPNGWVLQYFCGTGVAHFEGFNLFANFDKNGKVTMASNHRLLRNGNAGKYTEAVSLYSLLLEDGPVLAFNTWSDVLTPFVDPVNPWAAPSNLMKDGEGMQGDHNFVIIRHNHDEVILRGERHDAEVRLVKCPTTWQEYIADTDKLKSYITNTSIASYYVTTDTDTLYFTGLRNGRFRYSENLTNPVKLDSLSCVFTPKGFRTERQDSIGTRVFHEFTLSADSTCLVNEDGTVKVMATWDNYMMSHSAVWKMDQELFTAEQKDLFDKINTEIKKFNSAWSLESLGIGQSSGTNKVVGLVLTFYTNTSKTKTNTAGVSVPMTRIGLGKMQISYTKDEKVDKNMESIVKKAPDVETYARSFANLLNGTYNITPNNYFLPTGGEYNAVSGGITFRLK